METKKITAEIAKILRDKPPTRKFRKAIRRHQTDVLHKHLSRKGIGKEVVHRYLTNFQAVETESVKRTLMRRRKKVKKYNFLPPEIKLTLVQIDLILNNRGQDILKYTTTTSVLGPAISNINEVCDHWRKSKITIYRQIRLAVIRILFQRQSQP